MPEVAKCSCDRCGVHLEFPNAMAGSSIACPKCGAETLLRLSAPDLSTSKTPAEPEQVFDASANPQESKPSVEMILAAFRGKVKWHGTSLFYQMGLLLVTAMIVMLPLVYVALVAGAGYGVYWWTRHFYFLVGGHFYGAYIWLAKMMFYITPIFTGTVIVFFMLKPLLAKRPPGAQPLALNPASEPQLFAFITRICQTIGAPMPARIDVDCQLNASARFRRGFKSLLGNDLVLTIGLPLATAMSATQLAGIIAHEFGHFTQGFAMRLNYIIRRVNGWFARVVHERDEWDLMLVQWAEEAEDWRFQLIVMVAHIGIWFSRLLLKGFMLIGIGSSSFISRQMEYDADLYAIKFAGSQAFEEMKIRLATFDESLHTAYKQMRVSWNSNHALPENFPAYALAHDARMSLEKRSAIADRVGLERSNIFSTHPASGDRIGRARRANAPGVFSLDFPATTLFENFDALARQVSLLHYIEEMEIPQPMIQLRQVETFFESPKIIAAVEETNAQRKAIEQALGPGKLKLQALKTDA